MGKRLNENKLKMVDYVEKCRKETEELIKKLEKEGFKIASTATLPDKNFVYSVLNFKGELSDKDENKVIKIISKYGVVNKEESSKSQIVLDFPEIDNLKEKSFKKLKKSKLNEENLEFFSEIESKILDDLKDNDYEILDYEFSNSYVGDGEGDEDYIYDGYVSIKNYDEKVLDIIMKLLKHSGDIDSIQEGKNGSTNVYFTVGYGNKDDIFENKKQFKKFTSKAINEAELTELKDAIINREEFVDENVVGTSIGEDYIVSVFDKAVLIFTSDNTPFIIGREDLTEEEMDIVEELYSVLEISVDIDDEEYEDDEIFADDNTSDNLEMTEKSLKESSYPKADKELKSVVKDLKDEFEISSSEVDKGVHGNDYAEEQGYDYLYVGKVTYKNDVPKDMLDEYKEWYEDVYGGRFDYDLNNKTIEFELGYGDDKDMAISMEKFMFESRKSPRKFKNPLKESKKSKVKTLIKESGERVTTFKKGFNFKKYKI